MIFFKICYHAGGSTKYLRRSKVKRRNEDSSQSDASTPKKGRSGFAGKMRTYLWALSNEHISPIWLLYYHVKYEINNLPFLHGIVFLFYIHMHLSILLMKNVK